MKSRRVRALTFENHRVRSTFENLIEEVPMEIIINNSQRILIMHTPTLSKELVYGFLYTDGYVSLPAEIKEFSIRKIFLPDGALTVEAFVTLERPGAGESSARPERISYSSCGICGREGLEQMRRKAKRIKSTQRFSIQVMKKISEIMKDFQPLYAETRAAHAALVFDASGNFVLGAEDVGRHNAIDKVIGKCLLEHISTDDKAVVSSGRASLEMILKAVRGGFPLFAAMSRPTFRAVEAAKFYNLTLIDLARDSNRIYSHARRLREYQG